MGESRQLLAMAISLMASPFRALKLKSAQGEK
jgi:hypothetical protein